MDNQFMIARWDDGSERIVQLGHVVYATYDPAGCYRGPDSPARLELYLLSGSQMVLLGTEAEQVHRMIETRGEVYRIPPKEEPEKCGK